MTVWLTTKGGDKGKTDLYDGTRVDKDDRLVDLYGTVDEAQAALGLARSLCSDEEVKTQAQTLERRLYDLMAVMARSATPLPPVEELETFQEEARQAVGERFAFRLPGSSTVEAAFHLARTIVRRAERLAVSLAREGTLPEGCLVYLNRLSDCLYALMLREVKNEH